MFGRLHRLKDYEGENELNKSENSGGSSIIVKPLEQFDPADWKSVYSAFEKVDILPFIPADSTYEARFQPGAVKVGWRNQALWVYARLEGCSIFNSALTHNELMWSLGDTFEMFLRPLAQARYYEFHVTPQNLRLQLRFKSEEEVNELREWGRGLQDSSFVEEPLFQHWTNVNETEGFWEVLAEIPAESVVNTGSIQIGDKWRFLFSRYDFAFGDREKDAVLSSTSNLLRVDFHHQADWRTLEFAE